MEAVSFHGGRRGCSCVEMVEVPTRQWWGAKLAMVYYLGNYDCCVDVVLTCEEKGFYEGS